MIKKIISIILVLTILFVPNTNLVHAKNNNCSYNTHNQITYYIKDNYIVDQKGHKYSDFHTTSGENISLEEALNILNNNACANSYLDIQSIVPADDTVSISSYNKKYIGTGIKVSPDCKGPGNLTYSLSSSVSYSISGSFTATAQTAIMQSLQLQLGISLTLNTTSTETVSVNYEVDNGKTGPYILNHIMFV